MLALNYDKNYDVLYMGVADNSNSYGADMENDINVFRDVDTDAITGFVIFGFMNKFNNHSLPLISEPLAIDFSNDVIPHIL